MKFSTAVSTKRGASQAAIVGEPDEPAVDLDNGTRTFLTTDHVLYLAPNSLRVVRLGVDQEDAPWILLELTTEGVVQVTRDSKRVTLCRFNVTDLADLARGRAELRRAKASLVEELVKAPAAGSNDTAAVIVGAPAPSKAVVAGRSGLKTAALLAVAVLFGVLTTIVLAIAFGPKPASAQIAVRGGAARPPLAVTDFGTAQGLAAQLEAPAAFNALPPKQQRDLLALSQRIADDQVAVATGMGAPATSAAAMQSNVANLVKSLSQSTPVSGLAGSAGLPQGAGARQSGGPVALDAQALNRVKAATQIPLSTGGTVFYGFVDPMCSSCQDLEQHLKSLDKGYSFVAVPVGFQSGGREQAAAALCAKDKLAAWHKAMSVQPVGNPPCEDGLKQVDLNNKLFRELGFTATPALVAPNGHIEQLSMETAGLVAWVNANPSANPR